MDHTTYYIVDGNSFIYRAFFAVPQFTTRDGLVINALFGFTKMLLKLLRQADRAHVIVAFDTGKESFRTQMFAEYKAHRDEMPGELREQIPLIHQLVDLLHLPTLAIPGVEADDAIASFVTTHPDAHHFIVTGDKDLMQLVNDRVRIYDTMKEKTYDIQGVIDKMGVPPEQITDLLGLMGDSSDNIPGVKGIGPKTAVKLLQSFSSMEEILAHAHDIPGSVGTKLRTQQDMAKLSKQLATVRKDIDLTHVDLHPSSADTQEILEFCTKYEFFSLKKDVEEIFGTTSSTSTPAKQESIMPDLPKITFLDPTPELLETWLSQEVTISCHQEHVVILHDTNAMQVPITDPYVDILRTWLANPHSCTIYGLKELAFLLSIPAAEAPQLQLFSS